MKIVSRRAVFGDDLSVNATAGDNTNVDLNVRPTTAASALGLWVLAGVLTHVAIRFVDRWFEGK